MTAAAFASIVSFLFFAPGPAFAEDPVDLSGAYLLDTVGAVTGQEGSVLAAIDSLYDRTGIKLFVVYVDRFDGADSGDWANTTAELNGFGKQDVLLAIATVDRNYELSYPADFAVSATTTDSIESDRLVPALRDDRWADAAIATADGLAGAASGGGFPWLPVGAVVVAGGAGALIYSRVRRKRREVPGKSEPTQKQLDQESGRLLVQLDDSLRTSEQELGFAIAQFGDDVTKQFTTALAGAKSLVRQAFELRQKLDDAFPESAEDKRAMTLQIIELCTAADTELDAQADAFDELRQLEKTAPDALAAARTGAQGAQARLAAARETLAGLQKSYSSAALSAIDGNPDQVEKLLAFAEESAKATDAAIEAGNLSAAAVSVRAVQQSLGQTDQLLSAIDSVAGDLAAASSKLDAAVTDTRQDLAAARALPAGEDPGLAPAVAAAESALASAQAGKDPIASLAALQSAGGRLDAVLASVRDQQERVQRAKAGLDAALSTARARISSANDYVTTRRGGIGDTARTRLSEATRHLEQAVAAATSDPIAALSEAQTASSLAETALRSAQADVTGWDASGNYSDSSYAGAGLGGLLGELLGGGGSSRGNRGGGGIFGGSGGGGLFGGGSSSSGGRSRSSSFGGSSRSSGGGGRRSSAGRRGSGGRF